MENLKILRFEKSKTKFKKYDSIILDKMTGKKMRVPFGDIRYFHYKDSTPNKLYSRLDHLDKKRKANYLARHRKTMFKKFSPSWHSAIFLWDWDGK